jgi:hypothetical protein
MISVNTLAGGCSVYSEQAAVFYRNTDKEITVMQ